MTPIKSAWGVLLSLGSTSFLLFVLVACPDRVEACESAPARQQPLVLINEVSSSIQGADARAISTKLRDRISSSGDYQVQLSEHDPASANADAVDACTPVFGLSVEFRQENSDPGTSVGLGGLVARTVFTADVAVSQEPAGLILDRFTLQEKMDGLFAGSGNSKAFTRLVDRIGATVDGKREQFLAAWIPTPLAPFEAAKSPTAAKLLVASKLPVAPVADATSAEAEGPPAAIPTFGTLDEALDAFTFSTFETDVGAEMAETLLAAAGPELRFVNGCIAHRLDADEEREVMRAIRFMLATKKGSTNVPVDFEAVALHIYGSKEATAIQPYVQKGGVLLTSSIDICREQLRIRKGQGY